MRKVILDFASTSTREEVQDYLAMKLDFPDYYGKNLDALYDCLTEIDEDTCIGIFEPADENRTVDSYLEKVKIVMRDAEEDNAHICIISGSLEENFDLFGAEAY